MRKIISLMLMMTLSLPALTACTASADQRTGEAEGYGGTLKVSVTMNGTDITDVKVTEHNETQGVGTRAIDALPEAIVEATLREDVRLVGLSALMTTTLPAMEETVRQLKRLPTPPAIMLGGAVVTQDYADRLGCHYARDAKASVEIARNLLG